MRDSTEIIAGAGGNSYIYLNTPIADKFTLDTTKANEEKINKICLKVQVQWIIVLFYTHKRSKHPNIKMN